MAGTHQIWKMPLDESEIGPYAGNGREDIVDGPLLPHGAFRRGFASFAQPSGLATDGTSLFVADSEASSIRAVPFGGHGEVRTVVGTVAVAREAGCSLSATSMGPGAASGCSIRWAWLITTA